MTRWFNYLARPTDSLSDRVKHFSCLLQLIKYTWKTMIKAAFPTQELPMQGRGTFGGTAFTPQGPRSTLSCGNFILFSKKVPALWKYFPKIKEIAAVNMSDWLSSHSIWARSHMHDINSGKYLLPIYFQSFFLWRGKFSSHLCWTLIKFSLDTQCICVRECVNPPIYFI